MSNSPNILKPNSNIGNTPSSTSSNSSTQIFEKINSTPISTNLQPRRRIVNKATKRIRKENFFRKARRFKRR